ncbi:antigen 5 like allergen Cul n 1-like [Culex pipiens pallens]|uniref:antigen 5 like allergen Cul n 1-like n=1 Tax=Culex pipiens pallens TaxID=42434 RepID=UPI0019545B0B|nr:antigen 5 like allergen Cul n 1-like [Culex pipiens pallens]
MKLLVLATFLAISVQLSVQQNYCDKALCPKKGPHIACNGLTTLAKACGASGREVPMDATNQALILDLHNKLRSTLASGKQTPYPAASKMPTVQWDKSLADIAAANARRCVYGHDACRNTVAFPSAGQNIASSGWSGMTFTDVQLITKFVNLWYDEYKVANPSYTAKYPSGYSGPDIGHFTQIASDRTDRIGCAMVTFKPTATSNKAIMVCNYGLTNVIGQPVYVSGTACSGCKTGCSKTYAGLCSTSEVVVSKM